MIYLDRIYRLAPLLTAPRIFLYQNVIPPCLAVTVSLAHLDSNPVHYAPACRSIIVSLLIDRQIICLHIDLLHLFRRMSCPSIIMTLFFLLKTQFASRN